MSRESDACNVAREVRVARLPDFIPVLGQLDDAVIVPVLLILGMALVPAGLMREHRAAVLGTPPGGEGASGTGQREET